MWKINDKIVKKTGSTYICGRASIVLESTLTGNCKVRSLRNMNNFIFSPEDASAALHCIMKEYPSTPIFLTTVTKSKAAREIRKRFAFYYNHRLPIGYKSLGHEGYQWHIAIINPYHKKYRQELNSVFNKQKKEWDPLTILETTN